MKKTASPNEVVSELRAILAYVSQEQPSRARVAGRLSSLADRLGAGYTLTDRGLEKPGGAEVTLQEGCAYYMGASSSPTMVVLTSVTDDKVKYRTWPFTGSDRVVQRWIAADEIAKGTKTHLQTYGRYMDPDLKKSMESLLRGGRGRKEHMEDYHPVTVRALGLPEFQGKGREGDLWYAAEEYGGVGGEETDDGMVYDISTDKKRAEQIKNDRRFKVLDVKPRKTSIED